MTPRRTAAAISAGVVATAATIAAAVALLLGGGNVVLESGANWQAEFDARGDGVTYECRGTHVGQFVRVRHSDVTVLGGEDCVLAGDGQPHAFLYESGGERFSLRGDITITGYQPDQQRGVIHATGPSAWAVEGITLERNGLLGSRNPGPIQNAAYGIRIGDNMLVSGVTMRHTGSICIGGVGLNVSIANNEMALCNWADTGLTEADVEALRASLSGSDNAALLRGLGVVDPLNEGGCSKFVRTTGIIAGNWCHHSNGPGIWTDIDNGGQLGGLLITDNLVEHNANDGIKHEISYSADIVGNVSRYNGWGFYVWGWGAQLMVQNSSGVNVRNNEIRVGADGRGNGLVSINQNRGSGAQGPWVSTDVEVTDNTIVLEGTRGNSGIFDDTPGRPSAQQGEQTWAANTYVGPTIPTGRHWEHSGSGPQTFAGWQSLGYGAGSQALTEIPPTPSPTPTASPSPTATPTPTPPTPSPTAPPSPTASPSPTPEPPPPTPTASPSPSPSPEPTPTATATASPTPSPTATATPDPTPTPTPTPTLTTEELLDAIIAWLVEGLQLFHDLEQ